jgi:outer membrane protein OmpA-like peptidoglycan-associated protein
MLSSARGGQPRSAEGRVQAAPTRLRLALTALLLGLSGCASFPSSMNPVSWWHGLQGGAIAQQRPPPPGANEPYPNLATVPPRPEEPDRAALANIASALIADRRNAQHIAEANPIPDPSSPSASPDLFGKGTLPPPPPPAPPGSQPASATLAAAEAKPEPAPPPANAATPGVAPAPSKAPVGSVASTPLAPPGAAEQPAAVQAAAPPPLPTAPPAPPSLPGVAAPRTPPPVAAAPPPPAPKPPAPAPAPAPVAQAAPPPAPRTQIAAATPPAPPPAARPSNTVSVTFVLGSARLPSDGANSLKQLAARRGNGIIVITGYGDATSNDPDAQSAALSLGLSRAQAMAGALTSAGVPPSAVQVDAQAVGRGGTARLVQ